ncbi:unnamed protein product [Leptosia nina]|uniref:Uncharacterized protein n=1 Tax=Leptosia nina TaxID=320188 RepID=A0AAV1JXV2_9NEOP
MVDLFVNNNHLYILCKTCESVLMYGKSILPAECDTRICDSDCRFLNVNNAKYGAFIWDNSEAHKFLQELHRNHEQVWLLGSPEALYTSVHGKAKVVMELL